ncbi:MAG: acyl carrier protein [Sciscionella sp.]
MSTPAVSDGWQAEVKQVVCQVLEVDDKELGMTTLFHDDLGADSMKLIDLLATFEIKYDVDVDESELDHMIHLGGVLEVLARALK